MKNNPGDFCTEVWLWNSSDGQSHLLLFHKFINLHAYSLIQYSFYREQTINYETNNQLPQLFKAFRSFSVYNMLVHYRYTHYQNVIKGLFFTGSFTCLLSIFIFSNIWIPWNNYVQGKKLSLSGRMWLKAYICMFNVHV